MSSPSNSVSEGEADRSRPGSEHRSPEELVDLWLNEAKKAEKAHAQAADRYSRRHFGFGATTVVVTTIVGSGVFATLQTNEVGLGFKLAAGALTLIAAALSALQTFMKSGARSESHRFASRRYGELERKLEELQAFSASGVELRKQITQIRKDFDEAGRPAFNVPTDIWAKTHPESEHAQPRSYLRRLRDCIRAWFIPAKWADRVQTKLTRDGLARRSLLDKIRRDPSHNPKVGGSNPAPLREGRMERLNPRPREKVSAYF